MNLLLRQTAVALLALMGLLACSKADSPATPPATATFAVLSDDHLHNAAALGASGADFEAYLAQDRKMIVQSEEILDVAFADLGTRKLDFILVTGDLTKDGERLNHQLMAFKLAQIAATGTKVFVLPGNHDINNPDAMSFLSSPPVAVEQVTPALFKQIYADCGYKAALYQDPNSLSYIAEPVPGLWLFALDSAKYADNVSLGTPVTSGAFSAATQAWILGMLQTAKTQGKVVIGGMHHGIVEHFTGQSVAFPDYVLDNFATVGKSLSDAGLNLMFTGHFHANDVAMKDFTTSKLYDCETGSLVTAPCPYRIVNANLTTRTFQITTSHVTSIPSFPTTFQSFETSFLQQGLTSLTITQLTHAPYSLPTATAAALAPLVTAGMMAHYAGDENLTDPAMKATLTGMAASTSPATSQLGQSILSLWTDITPADNNLTITLP